MFLLLLLYFIIFYFYFQYYYYIYIYIFLILVFFIIHLCKYVFFLIILLLLFLLFYFYYYFFIIVIIFEFFCLISIMFLNQKRNKYIFRNRDCLLLHMYAPKVNSIAASFDYYCCALVIRVNN